ncbi:GNAT family N-acetyltransferase [Dyella sp.]|jgi:GNAT superfamily N-acetyltransferase|uniref:GNAT family N-acetyltransferase n=1 Tax=Dyella sp. TaxID=1869338 RepID=UPI002D79503A|nr:GNAT family N-acetyltransferase [Dyella sp.]HET6433068.1 GNAT family N-acetyltransferase [Dyella sp.]
MSNSSNHSPGAGEAPAPPSEPLEALEALEGTHWIETLRDGTRVLIRPLRPEDREREEAFIARLSHESRRFRFLCDFKTVSPAMLRQLMDLHYPDQMAFVALAHDNGTLREVGVSRYAANGDGTRCECAVTVADDWRHRGLGVLLMQHLIHLARRNGFKQMFSIDAAENEPMHELAHHLGFERRLDPDDAAQVIHTLTL